MLISKPKSEVLVPNQSQYLVSQSGLSLFIETVKMSSSSNLKSPGGFYGKRELKRKLKRRSSREEAQKRSSKKKLKKGA